MQRKRKQSVYEASTYVRSDTKREGYVKQVRLSAWVIVAACLPFSAARADDHVLPLSELHDAISQSSATRAANRAAIDRFFSEPRVETSLKNAGIDATQLRRGAALLSDEEQARLAVSVRSAQSEIAGGALKDSQ